MVFYVCFDYPVLHDVFNLAENQYLYVTDKVVYYDYNVATRTITEIAENAPKSPNTLRLPFRTGRDFAENTEVHFTTPLLAIPLHRVYLDFDVHVPKGLIENVLFVVGKFGLEKENMDDAFHELDASYPSFLRSAFMIC